MEVTEIEFDYQSDRHCAKTPYIERDAKAGLITSQIDTAPKQHDGLVLVVAGLITSQIDTAPKPHERGAGRKRV